MLLGPRNLISEINISRLLNMTSLNPQLAEGKLVGHNSLQNVAKELNSRPLSGADTGFFLGGGAPLKNDVTDGEVKKI